MYKKKYLKYKKKYLDLKIQSGGERDADAERGADGERDAGGESDAGGKRDTGANIKEAFLGNTIRIPEPLAEMSYRNMISNLDGKEIIRSCANNKQLCTQINWIRLLRERAINFNPLGPLPIPKMCLMMADDRQKEACTKFYHYTKGGKIVIWGNNGYYQRNDLPAETAYIAIACGEYHSVALKNDGKIVTWGANNFNQRNDSPIDGDYIAIACGYRHSVALKNDGTIVTWGNNQNNQRNDSPTGAGYIAIACGRYHSVALKNDGRIITWGGTGSNQRANLPKDVGYVAIACGRYHSVALKFTLD